MSTIQTKPEPHCPDCGAKMILWPCQQERLVSSWGCSRQPNCRGWRRIDNEEIVGKLRLDLDDLYTDGYYYTSFDVGGGGHSIVIEAKDRDAFLDEFARIWREKAAEALEEWRE